MTDNGRRTALHRISSTDDVSSGAKKHACVLHICIYNICDDHLRCLSWIDAPETLFDLISYKRYFTYSYWGMINYVLKLSRPLGGVIKAVLDEHAVVKTDWELNNRRVTGFRVNSPAIIPLYLLLALHEYAPGHAAEQLLLQSIHQILNSSAKTGSNTTQLCCVALLV